MTVYLSEYIHPEARALLESKCTVVDNLDHPEALDAIILRNIWSLIQTYILYPFLHIRQHPSEIPFKLPDLLLGKTFVVNIADLPCDLVIVILQRFRAFRQIYEYFSAICIAPVPPHQAARFHAVKHTGERRHGQPCLSGQFADRYTIFLPENI